MSERQKPHPLVSIVLLNWNGLEDTKICLEHVRKLSYPNYEIVVVDNGSIDNSKEYLSKLDDIIYVDNPKNRGFTGGHIDGLSHCKGEYVVLLNNDAVMKHDYIEKALEHFNDPDTGAVGGRAYWWNDEQPLLNEENSYYSYQEIDLYTGEARMQSHDFNTVQEVNNVSGSCVMVRREVINDVGYLYDRYFAYFEETDLFARMKRAGYKVLYDPRLRIWHRNGATSGSSTGSHFFYFQIFRNRFIFATRNFETRFMWRFWLIYGKISAKSTINWLLGRGDRTMNRAYTRAAFYNLFTLPYTLASRWRLSSRFGKNNYNHQLYSEQSGTSIVIDCSETDSNEMKRIVAHISMDVHPLHEYVLIVPADTILPKIEANARYVVDRGYFETPALNLGCVAAKFSWMLICDANDLPNLQVINSSIAHGLDTRVQLLGFKNASAERATFYFIRKELFERTGGLTASDSAAASHTQLIHYAERLNILRWNPLPAQESAIVKYTRPTSDEWHIIDRQIKFDDGLIHANALGWFTRMQSRYYRLYQLVTLIKWLFVWRIPLRLKAARLKNLVVYILTLRIKPLAEELKHMHNEVLIYGGNHAIYEAQRSHIKTELKRARRNHNDIPVFIICYERVDALAKLVSWLESHGFKKIVFIDNDSTYPALLDYYAKTPYQVIRLMRNVGHTSPWTLGIVRSLVPKQFYIVSDPDVLPVEDCPNDFVRHFLKLHEDFIAYQKVGFGLKIDDIPDQYPLKDAVVSWEAQFWQHPLADGLYEAGVDTTFALYKPFTYRYVLHPSIRTGEPYVARHLPWYHNPANESEEDIYYRYRANSDVNSWNTGELPERYKKEMDKLKK